MTIWNPSGEMSFRFSFGAGLVAIVFSLVTGCTGPEPLAARAPNPDIPHYLVMSFNVHRDRSNDPSTVEAIGAPDADIVCLQEPTNAWETVLRARYSKQYPNMLFHPDDEAGGLAILSKFPLEDHGVMAVEPEWHPAWHVIVQTPAGKVQVMNVHLRAVFDGKGNPLSSYVQTSEDHVTEISSFMNEAVANMPTLVMGDFNEGPKGDTVKWLEARGFRNALQLFHPGQFTWRAAASLADSLDMAIDHIMFDPAFEPLDSWIANQGNSDHFPVLARLEMPPKDVIK